MFKHIFNTVIRGGGRDPEPPSLDKILEHSDKHLNNFSTLVQPLPESKPRTSFNADTPKEEQSMLNLSVSQRLKVMSKALPLFTNMQIGARMYDGKSEPPSAEATPEFIAELEALARKAGAVDVGYVKVPRNAIFQGKGLPCEYAVVFSVEMDKEPIDTSPSFESQLEVMDGYKRMATISMKMARFMRKHGFAAYPGTALGGITDYPHLAELAGMGAIGYHGLLISPGEGARLRINTIYTNISNLPTLEAQGKENEHLWIRDFCAMCKKCIRKCPVEAIYEEPRPRGDGGMQTIDHATCRDYFAANYGCAVCLAICPFSQVGYEKVQARFKGNPEAPQFRIPVEMIQVATD
ncbi:MAG: reductive dehalogenase domain-containing protein [Ardenticatenaceae bacterium]|nr:reductive dehalogenase domain-containing protein [Ardenticatenaceae bacterium]